MKNSILSLSLAVLSMAFLLSSCSKSSGGGGTSSGNLSAGKAAIVFNNSGSFAGGTSFSISNTATTLAQTNSNTTLRNVSLSATEVNGLKTRTCMIMIIVPAAASTSSGNLTADLSLPNNATILPTITLTSTDGSTPGTSYSSESGTMTITKLTSTEVEGTFSGVLKDVNSAATLTLSNGSFAGKFE